MHLIPKDAAIKRLCFDEATQALRPNLALVDERGAVVFEINELGLKGAARDPSRKLAVVWGDSVVFGNGWSWPCLIDEWAAGYQFLNGGIEGDLYDNVLRRAAAFNRAHDVALNLVMPGWHPAGVPAHLGKTGNRLRDRWRGLRRIMPPAKLRLESTNRDLAAALTAFVGTTPNTVLLTMPTAINARLVERDLSACFQAGDRETVFNFAGDVPYSLAMQQHLFDHVSERNAIVRDVARATGTPLLDLWAVFETAGIDDFRRDFFDMLHLRPSVYPKAARAAYDAIAHLL